MTSMKLDTNTLALPHSPVYNGGKGEQNALIYQQIINQVAHKTVTVNVSHIAITASPFILHHVARLSKIYNT